MALKRMGEGDLARGAVFFSVSPEFLIKLDVVWGCAISAVIFQSIGSQPLLES